jgi:FemAB-related protein (PEP-CTERM system-associated)
VSPAAPAIAPYEGTAGEWDDFVRGSAGWSHFHLYGWRGVMERAMGHDTPYLAARNVSGRLEGVLPLVRVRSLVFGDYLVSMPFLNYGGPLGSEAAVRSLAHAAVELADQAGCSLMELRSRHELALDLPASHRKVTVTMPLTPGDPDAVLASFKAKVRSQVRRPRKEGVAVEFGHDQLGAFYAVFAEHMRDLGTPVLSRCWFEEIAATFGDSAWFACARMPDGKPVAGGCGFRWASEFEMTWASSLWDYSRIAPNMLLYWRFMERAAEEGLETFNFGRCTPDGGTHRFKMQWGGMDEPLWWYHRPADAGATTPNPDEGALSLGPKLWRKLPLPIAGALGPRIVRLIP